jgi:RNA polymerase sigma-70 factor (ECF subfamily)
MTKPRQPQHRPTAETDAQLLARTADDSQAFALVYDRYCQAIHAWFRARVSEDALALDLTAETFAQALKGAHRFRDQAGGSAAPWLFAIAGNLLARYRRNKVVETAARRRLGMPLRHYDDVALDAVETDGQSRALSAALASLPGEQRAALELRIIDDLSYKELGDRLSITAPAARKRVMRALRFLRGRLEGGTL